jgi:hypothetical protein
MPCLDRFAEQDQAYRDACCRRRARAGAVEAASPLGWHRWVGRRGDVVAMEGFGASAPAKVLYSTSASRRGGGRAGASGARPVGLGRATPAVKEGGVQPSLRVR